MSTFLVMLREGAEAALIVAIVLTYLRSSRRTEQARWVWGGVAAAVVVAAGAGVVLHTTVGSLEGRSEEVVEGAIALVAAAVLTWVVFWMARRGAALPSRLRGDVADALDAGGGWALGMVGFVAVLREGLETALFLLTTGSGTGGLARVAGGLGGLAAAAALGFVVYRGGRRLNLPLFFRVTGGLIVLFAAGLVAKGVHEFQEAGLLPVVLDPLWDLSFGDPATSVAGRVAAEVFGWTPAPSLLQVAAYWIYLLPVGLAFWNRSRHQAPPGVEVVPAEATRQ